MYEQIESLLSGFKAADWAKHFGKYYRNLVEEVKRLSPNKAVAVYAYLPSGEEILVTNVSADGDMAIIIRGFDNSGIEVHSFLNVRNANITFKVVPNMTGSKVSEVIFN